VFPKSYAGGVCGEVAREVVCDTGAQGDLKQRGPTWEAASWVGDPPDTLWSRTLAASGSPSQPTGSGAARSAPYANPGRTRVDPPGGSALKAPV